MGVKDRDCIEERLLNLYDETGEKEKLIALEKKLNQEDIEGKKRKQKTSSNQAIRKKVSRNEPCPCGSGKKYKRCCG